MLIFETMKLFGSIALIAGTVLGLTDDEMAAFKCREGTYAQYEKVIENLWSLMRAVSLSQE